MENELENILTEIRYERAAQDAQWGGPEHDDEHGMDEFAAFIARQMAKCDQGRGPDVRDRFIKIAALAVAAVESYDRTFNDYACRDA